MKKFIINYILFVYIKYIHFDLSITTRIGRIILTPFNYIRIGGVILYSILCFPLVLIHMWLNTKYYI